MSTQEERLESGIKFLDATVGREWPFQIKLNLLNLSNPDTCVLGQTLGWGQGVRTVHDWAHESPVELGFDRRFMSGETEYSELTKAWKLKIKELREARKS